MAGLRLWKFPPSLPCEAAVPALPDPGASLRLLQGTDFAAELIRLANEILRHRFPIFGQILDTGDAIRWRRDYLRKVETAAVYFRRVPYLDVHRAGDHKYIWELNRHQHLVVLAQAYRLTEERRYLEEAAHQLESWIAENPLARGVNWTSALEVAFRALSWIWLDHLVGRALPPATRRALLEALYRHGCFLERNLSVYFSPNTHLLGEAVALHALGALYPDFPRSGRWRSIGGDWVRAQMESQIRSDGTHFEQSTYYHVYALDFFLLHALLAETPPAYREKLARMAEYLDALLGAAGHIPLIGDDDGGRLFHPYGERDAFGRATLATCGVYLGRPDWIRSAGDLYEQAFWWIGSVPRATAGAGSGSSRFFAGAGVSVMCAAQVQIVVKAGGFGALAGHSHSDVLGFTCRDAAGEILVDPGTYTYVADPEWRDRFRGAAAHNTVRIDQHDQATPAGPFRWLDPPRVRVREWVSTAERDALDAECLYRGFTHRRRYVFLKPDVLFVFDQVEGPPGEHRVEQFWHFGDGDQARARLAFSRPAEAVEAWRSRVFGSQEPAAACRVLYDGPLPVCLAAAVSFGESARGIAVEEQGEGYALALRLAGRTVSVWLSR